MDLARIATIHRVTNETDVLVTLNLDGTGTLVGGTGIGFFDHMLHHIAKHGLLDLTIQATGDTHIDDHHTVEDTGIALGQALAAAAGDKAGMTRYGFALLPMDETLMACALDFSGRGGLWFRVEFADTRIGATFASDLVEEFFRAVALNARMTLHLEQRTGKNAHHVAEACFKSFGRALDMATMRDARLGGAIPSTKGVL